MPVKKSEIERLLAHISVARSDLEAHRDIEQEEFDERSEKWQESEPGELAAERIASLNEAIDSLEQAESYLESFRA